MCQLAVKHLGDVRIIEGKGVGEEGAEPGLDREERFHHEE